MAARRGPGLGLGQVVAVTLGFLVSSFIVFVFGVWVGKDLAERRLAQEERVVRGAVVRTPAATQLADPDITFLDRLERPSPAAPGLAGLVVIPTPPPTTPTPRMTSVPTHTAAIAAGRPTSVALSGRPENAPPAASEPRGVPGAPHPTAREWADAGWTIQVTATADQKDAEALVARLRAKGYDAYTVPAPMRDRTWYRVRVGKFGSREDAAQTERRLRTTEGLVNAFVTSR